MDHFIIDEGGCCLGDVHARLTSALAAVGIDTAELDARLLLKHVLDISQAELILHPNKSLSEVEMQDLYRLLQRRLRREPLSRIFGETEFWSLPFFISPDTLDPRPDTETLVEVILRMVEPYKASPLRILDLGTGSGCVLVSLLKELPNAFGVGVDIKLGATTTAAGNAKRHEVLERASFMVSDWFEKVEGSFDIIVSNPPYIPEGEIEGLAIEVSDHDPLVALRGGRSGLEAYQTIIGKMAPYLNDRALIAFEIGAAQAEDVCGLLTGACFAERLSQLEVSTDLAGLPRVVSARVGDV